MKSIVLFFILTNLSAFCEEFPSAFEASKKGIINCSFKGNITGTHYTTPLTGIITNNKNKEIIVIFENGRTFIADDSTFQNLIITEEKILTLKPNQKKTYIFHAMCIESSDKAPSEKAIYALGPMAEEKLCKMTRFIQENKFYNSSGQNAIWTITNNLPIENIIGFDETNTNKIVEKAAEILGKPIPPKPSPNDYTHNLRSTNMKRIIEGYIEYDFPKSENVTIAMFDKNNIIVRELYHNPFEKPGPHKQKFQFDATIYNDKYYYIKLMVEDKVFYTRKFQTLQMNK